MKAWQHDRRSKHERGYGYRWKKTRALILKRDKGLCQPCLRTDGVLTLATEVDHIKPKYLGGTEDWANLQAICTDCHREKTLREAADARKNEGQEALSFDPEGRPIWPSGR